MRFVQSRLQTQYPIIKDNEIKSYIHKPMWKAEWKIYLHQYLNTSARSF